MGAEESESRLQTLGYLGVWVNMAAVIQTLSLWGHLCPTEWGDGCGKGRGLLNCFRVCRAIKGIPAAVGHESPVGENP